MTKAQTPTERVKKHHEARKSRKISLDGDALDRLAAYQDLKGLPSRSEALRELLNKAGF
jgi:metal-responsive CopG/Arc/MetJ family transcriptional regulator